MDPGDAGARPAERLDGTCRSITARLRRYGTAEAGRITHHRADAARSGDAGTRKKLSGNEQQYSGRSASILAFPAWSATHVGDGLGAAAGDHAAASCRCLR